MAFNIFNRALVIILIAAPTFGSNATNYTYLALGDSVPFGFDPNVTPPAPAKYTGYPEVVAGVLHLRQSGKEVNASCPGETSGTFLYGGVGNGCQAFKDTVGLHTTYAGTQGNFALAQLMANKHIDLVTLSIGGNDLLLVQQACANAPDFAACVAAALPGALQTYGTNLGAILSAIRLQAGYTGDLVLVKYYVPNNNPLFVSAIAALNLVMTTVGAQFGAKFADGFTAFQVASALHLGDPCAAGLLVRLNATTCDVDPSPLGQDVLAATVLLAIGDLGHHGERTKQSSQPTPDLR
jgi:lysophospholipase L1-like esterase